MSMKFNPKQFMIDAAKEDLKPFIAPQQLSCIVKLCQGEDSDWYITRMVELAAEILSMPKTYDQNGKGDQAIAHLH